MSISKRSFRQRRLRGFPLVEIMVVIVIIGVLGAVVVRKRMGRTGESLAHIAATPIEKAVASQFLQGRTGFPAGRKTGAVQRLRWAI